MLHGGSCHRAALLSYSFGIYFRALLVANRVAAATGSNHRGAFENRNGFKGLFVKVMLWFLTGGGEEDIKRRGRRRERER